MRILLNQMNPTVGDLVGNTKLILQGIEAGRKENAQLIVFPELALTGYPPEDLLLLPDFMKDVEASLQKIIEASHGIALIVGTPRYNRSKQGKPLCNSAALIENQKIVGFQDKALLPTYDVFDECRYFAPGEETKVWKIGKYHFGITICEDIWQHSEDEVSTLYLQDPIENLKPLKPDFIINISASPYSLSKLKKRLKVCQKASSTLNCPVLFCNQVGANDTLIFDGNSFQMQASGVVQMAKAFQEDRLLVDLSVHKKPMEFVEQPMESLYKALVLGIRDYFNKSGLRTACLGLSGGIDSALVACLAVEALGAGSVKVITMPSRYSSSESEKDAKQLSQNLGIECLTVSIEEPFKSYLNLLNPLFDDKEEGIMEENLQARIRGMLLMAFSNKIGSVVLNTGNKSELALGYCTLYGDMCGGISVIGDVTKTQVYQLVKWINREKEIIPSNTIERAPSAELRHDQKDSDSLPDYELLDHVLTSYIEELESCEQIVKNYGYPKELVEDIIKKIHRNEHKRRQAPPALRVSEKSFSAGRRFPIVQKYV